MKKTLVILIIALIFVIITSWDIKLYNDKSGLYQRYLAIEKELKSYPKVDALDQNKMKIKTKDLLEHFKEIASTFNTMPSQIIWYRKSLPDKLKEKKLEDIFSQKSFKNPQPSDEEISLSLAMNNYLVNNIFYRKSEDIPESESVYLIVWSPKNTDKRGNKINIFTFGFDTTQAHKVWLYKDGKLIGQDNKKRAIEEYRAKYIDNRPNLVDIRMWGYFEYRISSRTERKAEVYLISRYGFSDGSGSEVIFVRQDDGKWVKILHERTWIT